MPGQQHGVPGEHRAEDAGVGQAHGAEVDGQQQAAQQGADEGARLSGDGEQRQHAGARPAARLLPQHGLPGDLRLHRGENSAAANPISSTELITDQVAPAYPSQANPATRSAPGEDDGPDAVAVGEGPAHHEQPLLA